MNRTRNQGNRRPKNHGPLLPVRRQLKANVALSPDHPAGKPKRENRYTIEELATAAKMLQTLRDQQDAKILVDSLPMLPQDTDATIDLVIERLLATHLN